MSGVQPESHAPAEPVPGEARGVCRLSVVIVNWNTSALLRGCLESMRASLGEPWLEVIVVDNASSDDSQEMVVREFPQVCLLAQNTNLGFSRANNTGLRAARGHYLMILNSDTEIVGDALETMCDYMDENVQTGALGAQLLNTDGTLQHSCRAFPSHRTALFHRQSFLTRLFPGNRYSSQYLMTRSGHDHIMKVDWVMGACLMTRRDTVNEVGLLDEDYFMYAEDVDWCYRIKQAGWDVVYIPDAKVVHHYERTTRKVPYRMTWERHRSMWLFYRKHYSHGVVLIDFATWLGVILRCAVVMARLFIGTLFRRERNS